MIISRKYRYLFIELPLTASTAIAKELIQSYAGEEILYKHANYRKFLKTASPEEKDYFTFIGIRNPLDQAVSHYYKYVNDHKGKYSDPQKRRSGRLKYWLNERGHQKRYQFIKDNQATFSEFFLRFYTRPYMDWGLLDVNRMDAVIRFEHIQEDFSQTIQGFGAEQVRSLPEVNKTSEKSVDFWTHYDSEDLKKRAIEVFGPYMAAWNYTFPKDWNAEKHIHQMKARFDRELWLKKLYWSKVT